MENAKYTRGTDTLSGGECIEELGRNITNYFEQGMEVSLTNSKNSRGGWYFRKIEDRRF